ncbi:MAG TPA: DUF433 domain-containing protein [Pirellulales bacterium]
MATFTAASRTAVPSLAEYIAKTPGTCSGQPRIAGTRIKVKHVYVWVERMGMTPAQVVAEHPHLTRDQIHAARRTIGRTVTKSIATSTVKKNWSLS